MLSDIQSKLPALVKCRQLGFTLLELLIGIAILSALTLIAVPSYQGYVERAQVAQAMGDIRETEIVIARFISDNNGRLPESLADVGKDGVLDPWGRPYVYTDLTTAKGKGKARKDKKFNPINSAYDLYSVGKDGITKSQLDNKDSLDDVVRANDGRYVGLAAKYNN